MNFLVDIAPLTYGSIVFLLIVFGVGFTLGSFGGLFWNAPVSSISPWMVQC